MAIRQVSIITDGSGDFTALFDPNDEGEIMWIGVVLGTLNDLALTITDTATGLDLLDVASITADAAYQTALKAQDASGVDIDADAGPPIINEVLLAPICYGSLSIVAAADANTRGNIFIRTH